MIKAVIFDMDGTVFDTERISVECWKKAVGVFGDPFDVDEELPHMFGVSEADIGIYLRKKYGVSLPYEEILEKRAYFFGEYIQTNGLSLKAGVPSAFTQLRSLGCRLALASSATRARIEQHLCLADLSATFDMVISGEEVANSKPHPDIFLLAAKRLGVAPSETVVVEDSNNGALAGYRAGMRVAMVPDLQPVDPAIPPLLWHLLPTMEPLPAFVEAENK